MAGERRAEWALVQEDKGLLNDSWFLITCHLGITPVVHARVRGLHLATAIVDYLNETRQQEPYP